MPIAVQLFLFINVGLFFVECHGRDFSSTYFNGSLAEIQANPVLIHEWGSNYAIISINVVDVEIHLVLKLINMYWNTGAVADL